MRQNMNVNEKQGVCMMFHPFCQSLREIYYSTIIVNEIAFKKLCSISMVVNDMKVVAAFFSWCSAYIPS